MQNLCIWRTEVLPTYFDVKYLFQVEGLQFVQVENLFQAEGLQFVQVENLFQVESLQFVQVEKPKIGFGPTQIAGLQPEIGI